MEERITGVMVYYYFVCKRKLWYFCHDITMESGNDDVCLLYTSFALSVLLFMRLLPLVFSCLVIKVFF